MLSGQEHRQLNFFEGRRKRFRREGLHRQEVRGCRRRHGLRRTRSGDGCGPKGRDLSKVVRHSRQQGRIQSQ